LKFDNPLLRSVVLHGILLAILAFVKIGEENIKQPRYITLAISGSVKQKPEEKSEPKLKFGKEINSRTKSVQNELDISPEESAVVIEVVDSINNKPEIVISDSAEENGREQYLKFARSLLDSFLVSNPSYGKLILIEQIKGLKDSAFALQNLERKINDDLHKYLRENYPEGSANAINKYTGPGINIPIDDLIDIIGGIF